MFPEHYMYDMSEVFTARGCRNNCGFCAVRILEPNYLINERWKDSIDLNKNKVMIHDNNLITGDFNHFKEVTDYIKNNKLITIFDNGFDCRSFTNKYLDCIKGIKFNKNGLRFAFDNMSEDNYIQKTLKMCLDAKISKDKIMVYVLFNFKDTFEEAMYRMNEIKRLGARPYPQRYRPLDDIELKNNYISPNWDKQLLDDFRFYWMMPGIYTKYTWDEYINKGGSNQYGGRSKNKISEV